MKRPVWISVLLIALCYGHVQAQPQALPEQVARELSVTHFKLADLYLDLTRVGVNREHSYALAIRHFNKGLEYDPQNLYYLNRLGYAYHLERRLREASRLYARLLKLDPPQPLTEQDMKLVLKFAPLLYVNEQEYFHLEDVTVIVHPDRPLIEYSLYWDDDIDYPEDNDPTDHEKIWVQFNPETLEIEAVYAYFHRAIISTPEAVERARKAGQRPVVYIQWGGHGSLLDGWQALPDSVFTVKYTYWPEAVPIKTMPVRYQAHRQSIRMPDHPLAQKWPHKFQGTYEDYIRFTRQVDTRELIRTKGYALKSRWPNAVIDQYFLDYQFYPKIDWPDSIP